MYLAYLSPTLVNGLDGVRVHKRAEGIDVRDILLAQGHAVTPVQRSDVILHVTQRVCLASHVSP